MKKINNLDHILSYFVICVFFLLIIVQLLPLNERYNKESKFDELQVLSEIQEDTNIEQKINLDNIKQLDSYQIMFGNYENRKNFGKIKLQLVQGNVLSEVIIDVTKIRKDNSYYKIDFELNKFLPGEATVKIIGVDTKAGSSVAVYCSNSPDYFENTTLNGVVQEKSLVQKLNYSYSGKFTIVKYILFVALLLIMLLSFGVLIKERKPEKTKLLFICSFLIILLSFSIKYYFLLINAEPYAEQVENFFENAKSTNFIQNMLITDAGYLPLLQHIIAWICVNLLQLGKVSVWVMNLLALISVALICSLINYQQFAGVFSYRTRFLFSILLPMFLLENYENLTFINFVYYGIVVIAYAIILDLNKISRSFFGFLMIIIALLCLSKGFFVVMIPVMISYLVLRNIRISRRELIFVITTSLTSFVQLLYSFKYKDVWLNTESKDNVFSSLNALIEFAKNTIIIYSKTFISLFGVRNDFLKIHEILICGIFILIFTFVLPLYMVVIKKKGDRELFAMIILNIANLAESAFCALTVPYLITLPYLIKNRHEIFTIVTVFFTIAIVYSYVKENYGIVSSREYKFITGFIYGVMFIIISLVIRNHWISIPNHNISVIESPIMDYSSWSSYGDFSYDTAFSIPIKPNGRVYQKNSTIYFLGNGTSQLEKTQTVKHATGNSMIHKIELSKYEELVDAQIIGMFFNKPVFDDKITYKLVVKDKNNNVIVSDNQRSPSYKMFVGFLFENTIQGATSIEIYDKNNNKIHVDPRIYVVTKN